MFSEMAAGEKFKGLKKNEVNCIKNGVKGIKIAFYWVIKYKKILSRHCSVKKNISKVWGGGGIEMYNIYPSLNLR